ncbi:hypothetical protein AB3N04_01040 (plasmid) [Alkalihalophilus sp. As8PL]|uniref:MerR HTH family regulatory protein n=1 Tax=Alkalihalophilus sp. As8PL TaxID=3237103 RepID=A0AB39BMT8_9BACI
MSINTIDILESEFMDDPLKRQLEFFDLTANKLLPDFLNDLHPEATYSTTESAAFLQKNDSTLRNYLRNENLMKYIKPVRSGRFYRLNYKSIFRLHMILLYLDQGKTISDVEVLLGYRSETMEYDSVNPNRGLKNFDNEILGQILKTTNQRIQILEQDNSLTYKKREYDQLENRLEKKRMDVELIDHKISLLRVEARNQQLLTHTLKKATNRPKPSFLQSLLGKHEEVDVEVIFNESVKELQDYTNPKIKELEVLKENTEEDILKVEKELEEKKVALDSAEHKLIEKKKILLQEGQDDHTSST